MQDDSNTSALTWDEAAQLWAELGGLTADTALWRGLDLAAVLTGDGLLRIYRPNNFSGRSAPITEGLMSDLASAWGMVLGGPNGGH